MAHPRKLFWVVGFAGFSIAMIPAPTLAGTAVQFQSADLAAFVQLAKPEQSNLRIDGLTGHFTPGPAVHFAGLEAQDFDVNLNLGGELVDLRFNDLRTKAPKVTFEAGRIRIDISFEDQAKAIKSALGSISVKDLTITAWARIGADGTIAYDSGSIAGGLSGTGLLKPKWVINAVRNIALKTLKKQMDRQLSRPLVQDALEKGLVVWSRFSTDARFTRISAGTVKITADGIQYEAE
jgi:hypothetical protein